jgi:hypothetical protein
MAIGAGIGTTTGRLAAAGRRSSNSSIMLITLA